MEVEEITVHVCVLHFFQTLMQKKKKRVGCCICIQSESPLQPPFALSAVYIKKPK